MRPNAEIPITTELLRMILDLPPEYTIVGAYTRPREVGETVRLLALVDTLPQLPGNARHEVTPRFQRIETGQATLERIDVRITEGSVDVWDGKGG